MPRFTDSAISSSALLEPPCKTKGISTVFLISVNKSNFNLGTNPFGYIPCAVPIAIANESTPVFSTKTFASSGFV